MTILTILLIAYGLITAIALVKYIYTMIKYWRLFRIITWRYLFIGLFIIPITCFRVCKKIYKYTIKQIRIANDDTGKLKILLSEDTERIKEAYSKGIILRDELERHLDGKKEFELEIPFNNMYNKLLYIENEYNETFNKFFKRHGCIEFKQDIRIIYLPEYVEKIMGKDMLKYFTPWVETKDMKKHTFSAQDIMQYIFKQLSYPEDVKKLKHGIFIFKSSYQYNKYGVEVFSANYHQLEEGDDDYIMSQLTKIAESLYRKDKGPIHYSLDKDAPEEGVSKDYADRNFHTIYNNEIAILVKEVRERVIKLHQYGISESLILKMIKTPPMLSRLIITKDYRIMLPGYGNIEIKMEPLNKAVFLLFLRHEEGIIFKHLPDYEQELLEIYAKLKPNGINEKLRKSISDVCNSCLNSINEKCARIRGAFISHFDEYLAKNYYITGHSGQPKRIKLPRELVTWEEDIIKQIEKEFEQSSPFGVMRKTTFEDIAMTKSAIITFLKDKYPGATPVWNNIEAEVCNISFSINGKIFNALIEIWDEINGHGCRYVTETEYDNLLEYCKTNDSTPCIIAVTPPTDIFRNGKKHKQNKVIRISNAKTDKVIDFNNI